MLKDAPLLGTIPTSGRGKEKAVQTLQSSDYLWKERSLVNNDIKSQLKTTDLDEEMFRQTFEEAEVGRVSKPVRLGSNEISGLACHRLAVLQGSKPRTIDNGTSNGSNPCVGAQKTIR